MTVDFLLEWVFYYLKLLRSVVRIEMRILAACFFAFVPFIAQAQSGTSDDFDPDPFSEPAMDNKRVEFVATALVGYHSNNYEIDSTFGDESYEIDGFGATVSAAGIYVNDGLGGGLRVSWSGNFGEDEETVSGNTFKYSAPSTFALDAILGAYVDQSGDSLWAYGFTGIGTTRFDVEGDAGTYTNLALS